jgi:2-oxoisovalerate dehydrogenase E1 component alpha subunit
MAVKDVALRAAGYGIPGTVVDGNNPLAVYEAAKAAVDRARAGQGPTLIEAKVHRLMPHTSNDDDRYRSKEELESLWRDDPLPRFRTYLTDSGVLTEQLAEEIDQWSTTEINEATDFAMNSPEPDPSELFDHVYLES